jgi:predicted DNA binding CopG/RHH family protein
MEAFVDTEIRCKRIIEGKTYNTETSTSLGQCEHDWYTETLFKTRHGAYFVHVDLPNIPDEKIVPYEPDKAQKWMEEYGNPDKLEAEFGEMPEAGESEARITLRIPDTLRKRVAQIAETNGQSLNAWILRCLEKYAATFEAEG